MVTTRKSDKGETLQELPASGKIQVSQSVSDECPGPLHCQTVACRASGVGSGADVRLAVLGQCT